MKQNALGGVRHHLDRWGVWLSFVVGVVLILPLQLCLDGLSFTQSLSLTVGLSWALSLACVAVHVFTRRYFLEGILAGFGGGLSFQLWTTTDRYAFVRNADSLPFWHISLTAALLTVMGLVLVDYVRGRRSHPSHSRMTLSLLTLACVGVVMFGQCEATLTHLNVAWDDSAPRRHLCEVEGNWVERVSRGATQTVLLLSKDGQTVRLVRSASYAEYEEGESVYLLEYEGAFDKAYYVLEEKE